MRDTPGPAEGARLPAGAQKLPAGGARLPAGGESFETDVPARLDRLPWSGFHWLRGDARSASPGSWMGWR